MQSTSPSRFCLGWGKSLSRKHGLRRINCRRERISFRNRSSKSFHILFCLLVPFRFYCAAANHWKRANFGAARGSERCTNAPIVRCFIQKASCIEFCRFLLFYLIYFYYPNVKHNSWKLPNSMESRNSWRQSSIWPLSSIRLFHDFRCWRYSFDVLSVSKASNYRVRYLDSKNKYKTRKGNEEIRR